MFPLTFVSLSGNLFDQINEFNKLYDNWFNEMSDYVFKDFIYEFIFYFKNIGSNPLLTTIFVILLVVMAFHLLPLICRSFRR